MAAPNLIGATTINGKTTGVNLSTTTETSVLNNASSSGKCLKVNTLNVSNSTASPVTVTITYHTAASLGGTSLPLITSAYVPANATLNIIDKTSQYYLEENTSLGATAGTANALTVTVSYEDIS
jgi:hypothetical protein